ncbi:hypothetical protein ABZ682_21695 [Streptomyces griseoviridis]|uniref:hypothetical protein n=1 Tax=Streptomyces griseoviridis TaxID=45398 RepID=UPI0033FF0770
MSRETDTPSSGPNGRGGAAYPSGTPPYGTPVAPDAGTDAARSGSQPEDRKTETTLTTRIRINIPGSRPIPPVVVRTTVADSPAPEETGETPAPPPAVEPPAEAAAPPAGEKTSDWFAPRKGGAPKGGQGAGATNGAGLAVGPAAAGAAPPARPALPGRPSGVTGAMGASGGSRPGSTNGAGLPGVAGGPVAPGHGGGTGSFDVTEALAAGNAPRPGPADAPANGTSPYGTTEQTPAAPAAAGGPNASYDFTDNSSNASAAGNANDTPPSAPGAGEPRRDELPYFAEGDQGERPGGQGGYGGPGGAGGFEGPGGPGGGFGARGPAGPTGGPATGEGPMTPPGAPRAAGPGPGGGLSDDTAILTPQKQVPEPGTPGYGGRPAPVSGHTVTSGIPVVPPGPNTGFAPGVGTDGPLPHTPPKLPEPVGQNVPASSAPKAKKKGRSKLVLLVVAAFVLAGGVYGAGLLMNHTDVPKGTTVLGVDIGGGTRDDAVKKLDAAFGERVGKPLKLSVDGKTVSLTPDQAGLQFDTQQTVASAARSDYNPVSVIGSLFGQKRVVEPSMPVDEEKLQAALKLAGGGSGSVREGTIKFESGKAVAVYGKAGKGIDAARSTTAVEDAYRGMVETGAAQTVTVPTTSQQPTVSNAEVDRMMKAFAEPAMSAVVIVQTDAAHQIPLGPVSLPKILGVKAIDGKLVETYNLEALKEAYGSTFDGVKVEGASGKRDVIPQDVVAALRKALLGRTTAERVGVIDTNPS